MAGRPVVIIGEVYDPTLSVGYPLPSPQPPLGIWGGAPLPWPTPPIYYPPQPPLGIWGGAPPQVGYPLPVPPQPGVPSHPIAGPPPGIWGGAPPQVGYPLPQPPLGIWGGGNVPYPTPPIYLPPGTIPGLKPEHPIYIPPSSPGVPAHPIVLPPPGSDGKPEVLENWDAKTYWSPATGWGVAIVPSESHPGTPTPSKT